MSSRRTITPALNMLRQAAGRPGAAAAAAAASSLSRPFAAAASSMAVRRATAETAAPRAAAAGAAARGQRRMYSQQADSKIWSFEDIQGLIQDPAKNVVIVDVREPGELKSTGHIPHAINIPVTTAPDSFHITEEEFEDRYGYARPSKDDEVVFYCKAGVRSRAAAGLAKEAGWKKVGEYPGSWMDWAGNGGKIER